MLGDARSCVTSRLITRSHTLSIANVTYDRILRNKYLRSKSLGTKCIITDECFRLGSNVVPKKHHVSRTYKVKRAKVKVTN